MRKLNAYPFFIYSLKTVLLLTFLLTSCVSQKQVVYFQSKNKQLITEIPTPVMGENIIKRGDELYIRVTSLDAAGVNFLSASGSESSQAMTNQNMSLISYMVNDSGFIRLPVIGRIQVADKTIYRVEQEIQDKLVNYLNTPNVVVKFINKTFSVMGLVRNPGLYNFSSEKMNIFQALSAAGDITEYGNKKKVSLIREENNNVKKVYLDLTRENIFTSEYFYIQSKDVIYIEPLKSRFWGFNTIPYGLIFSTISTTVLIISFNRTIK